MTHSPDGASAGGLDLDELEKVARAATVPSLRWFQDHAPTDEVLAIDEVSTGVAAVARVNPMAEWTDATAEAWGAHIATFDPPTVLQMIAALRALSPSPGLGEEPDEITEDALRTRAKDLVTRKGWRPGDKPSLHSIVQLMIAFGMELSRKPETARCAFPECGCDFDATCEAALSSEAPSPKSEGDDQ